MSIPVVKKGDEMTVRQDPEKKNAHLLAERIAELKSEISMIDPYLLAERTGTIFTETPEGSRFHFQFWWRQVSMDYPGLILFDSASGKAPGAAQQALVLYYYRTADGTEIDNRWISFSELPEGRFYTQAFHSYTGQEIAKVYGHDQELFEKAAVAVGGERIDFADSASAFTILPRVKLAAALWLGDEDFPASAQILFNAAAHHYLPTDACAIAGSMLTRLLIEAKKG